MPPIPRRVPTFCRLDPLILTIGLALAVVARPGAASPEAAIPRSGAADFTTAAARVDPCFVGILTREAGGRKDRGAGFVWRERNLVVTAAHVLAGASVWRVRLATGRDAAARLVGADDLSDVAVLRIDGAAPPCETAPTGTLRRGDPVAAVGDPLAFAATLTTGHVSSPARPWGETSPHDVVQHDAALNPGSSGGPLVDRMGRVVAMNIAIADGARRHVGIGFALPIETVEAVAERLLRDGEIVRPRLGLRLRSAEALRPAIPSLGLGLVVEAVEAGSPAALAGLTPGDVVTAIDGRPVEAPRDLARALEVRKPGETLALDLRSDTEPRRVILTLDVAPHPAASIATPPDPLAEGFAPGFSLAAAAPARIASIDPDGPAAGAGLCVGDELLSIGGRRPEGTNGREQVARAAAVAGAAGLALLVRRGPETRWVVLGPHGRLDAEAPFGSNAEAPTSHTF